MVATCSYLNLNMIKWNQISLTIQFLSHISNAQNRHGYWLLYPISRHRTSLSSWKVLLGSGDGDYSDSYNTATYRQNPCVPKTKKNSGLLGAGGSNL
jgi:hypothetical protein